MSMTKKDFIALADAFISSKPLPVDSSNYSDIDQQSGAIEQWEVDIQAVSRACEASNPRFNRERWLGYIAGENGPNGGAR